MPPVHLALVIDRSGSMKGGRLGSAIAAATTAIERLHDGDQVTVVAFDQSAQLLVPPTKLDAARRAEVLGSVKKLALGGDTCISCGLTMALDKLGNASEYTRRVLLLSDGEANVGIKDVQGFEAIARVAQKSDVSITTIGVGHDYDPKALTAISRESNGRHYYAENDAALPAIFDSEAKALATVVAANTEVSLRLAPGVSLVRVLDRAHRLEGSMVRVPLGQLTRDEHKTVLLEVALTPEGEKAAICNVHVQYKDFLQSGLGESTGELAIAVGPESEPTDPIVETRIQRSETAAALIKANELMAQGQAKAAAAVLGKQKDVLAAQKKKIVTSTKAEASNPYLGADLDSQSKAVAEAEKSYAPPPADAKPATGGAGAPAASPPPPPAKAAAAKAADDAFKMGY